jgi:hypothetical protein
MTDDISDTLERMCFDYIERGEPVTEDDVTWLIDTVDRLNRWLERMPDHGKDITDRASAANG